MPRRTNLNDAQSIELASDVDEVVNDKREQWRANPAKARRRQRRYKKRMTEQLVNYCGMNSVDYESYDDY